ncbi:MAG: UPF0182 family protein [Syntrophomonas sp.]
MPKWIDPRTATGRLVILLLIIAVFSLTASIYMDWLWFKSINLASVFTTTWINQIVLWAVVFVFTFLLFYVNLLIIKRHLKSNPERPSRITEDGREIIFMNPARNFLDNFLQGPWGRWIFIGLSLIGAFLVSTGSFGDWLVVQQFIHRVSVGVADPVFGRDLGFYFFNLNFYDYVCGILISALVLLLITVIVCYAIGASASLIGGNWQQFSVPKGHIAVLLALFFAVKAWNYWLSTFDILFSSSGVIYGAAYTDIYARLVAYKAMLVLSIVIAGVILVNIFIKRFKWIIYAAGAWVLVAVVMQGLYPGFVHKFVVQPDEFNKEKPYIENSIKFTRQAYNLDGADSKQFNIAYDLNIADPANRSTLENIRLWDWRPLKTTYQNLQQLRSYYVFDDVDVDRYTVGGKYRQVMLAVREMDPNQLQPQAQTWVNQRLMYTHGYGVVASPVNEVAQEGFPSFFIKDIPPRSSSDLVVNRPEIYFGEKTDSYVLVNTNQKEFDYPSGDQNVYTTYQGNNGIKIGSYARRLSFAWALKDYKLLLSNDVGSESQLLMNRNVKQRIQKVAPYLRYDSDPYIVIGPEGRLFWILDAYTLTSRYPYSQPFDQAGSNYIRNSVKIVTDAYTGEMTFYQTDDNDPLIKTYAAIFPGLYKPISEMPEGLRSHVRYPEDLFKIQSQMYSTFHMTDPYVFYNKEDAWVVPNQLVENKPSAVEPYYLLMRLPGEANAEYVMILPFTPKGRLNMVAWMGVRMDGANYGKIMVYNFPKQETIFGPEQVDARINQDTVISQQLTLWNQVGSRVLRGGILVIPMNNSILYIEPLYLQAENSQMPEFKRVIVGYGDKIVMESNLQDALVRLFGQGAKIPAQTPTEAGQPEQKASSKELIKQARQYYDTAMEMLKQGNWAAYGENINKLNEILARLEQSTAG